MSATLPETPESISSKINVGIFSKRAIMAFKESISLDSSPPEAHFATSTGREPDAEKRKWTASVPDGPAGASTNSTSKTALSNSSDFKESRIESAKRSFEAALDA